MKEETFKNDIKKALHHDQLQQIWHAICNFYSYTNSCEKCPLYENEELCLDSGQSNSDSFEKFLKENLDRKTK